MIAASTFSGVGGMDLGLTRAGFDHAFFAELDPWRRDVLAAHYHGVPAYADVRDVARGERIVGTADLLCGGFPCQDLSVAGKRAGLAGSRSGLFHEFARIADTLRPAWILLENVPGLLSSNDGRDMGVVIGTLADLGYGVAWRVLDARYFGVPQRRRRVFIVGHSGGDDAKAIRALCESCDGHPAPRDCTWQRTTSRPTGGARIARSLNAGSRYDAETEDFVVASTLQSHKTGGYRVDAEGAAGGHLVVADTLTSGSHPGSNAPGRRREDYSNLVTEFHQTQEPITAVELSPALGRTSIGMGVSFAENQRGEILESDTASLTKGGGKPGQGYAAARIGASVRRLTPVECERLMSWPDGWTAPDGVKAPDSRRYAACGDGVVSNVSEWIGRRILALSDG